jgi:hypothetical protein
VRLKAAGRRPDELDVSLLLMVPENLPGEPPGGNTGIQRSAASVVGTGPRPPNQEKKTVPATATPTRPDSFFDEMSYETEMLTSVPDPTVVEPPATECKCMLSVVGRCPTQL